MVTLLWISLCICICMYVCICVCANVAQSCLTLCNPMDWSPLVLCPWDSPGKNTRVGCHALLQAIFLTQGSNPGLPHCGQILYHLSHQGSPSILEWVAYPFSRGSSWFRNWTWVSCIAGRLFTSWATKEAHLVTMPQMKRSFFSSSNIQRSSLPLQLLLYFLFASLHKLPQK